MAMMDNIEAYYKFDNDVTDEEGNWDGTDVNTGDGAGIINRGRVYDHNDDEVKCGDMFSSSLSAFTFNMWINYNWDNAANILMGKYWDGSDRCFNIYAGATDGAVWNFYATFDGDNSPVGYTADSPIPEGEWAMVSVTYDDPDITLYLNGVEDGSYTKAGGLDENDAELCIGTDLFGGVAIKGTMDEIGIWKRELSAGEISSLWNDGSGWEYPFVSAEGTNMYIQVGEAWKEVNNIYLQIDNAWKEVVSAYVNKDDVWKTIF